MADIRPFRALRYHPRLRAQLEDLVMLPYDVVSPEAMRARQERSPWNLAHLEANAGQLEDEEADALHVCAAQALARWRHENVMCLDAEPALYGYRQHFERRGIPQVRQGFMALLRLEDLDRRIVLPHERTLQGPVEDRLGLLRRNRTQLSQLMVLHRDRRGEARRVLEEVFAEPVESSVQGGDEVLHELLPIRDAGQVRALQEVLAPEQVLIADGHHRYGTALAYRDEQRLRHPDAGPDAPWEFVCAFLASADDPALEIQPTHRLLHHLPDVEEEAVLGALTRWYAIEALPAGLSGAALDALIHGASAAGQSLALVRRGAGEESWRGWLLTQRREVMRDAFRAQGLDPVAVDVAAAALHEFVLPEVFGLSLHEQASTRHLRFLRSTEASLAALADPEHQYALILPSTDIEAIIRLCNAGLYMPQKSTFFFPKVLSGLVLYSHDGV